MYRRASDTRGHDTVRVWGDEAVTYGVATLGGRASAGDASPATRTNDPRAATNSFSGAGTEEY